MSDFKTTPMAKKYSEAQVKFVELMFDPRSDLNQEKNFEARLGQACEMAKVPKSILEITEIRELVHYYLSYIQYNNKYQLLVVSQLNFWYVTRKLMDEIGDEEDISKRDKMTDYAGKLEAKVESLYAEIYGAKEVMGIAQEQVKTALSPEQRLKNKTKKV